MNVNLVCKVGFKILAAVVAGAAVVIGIDKAVGGSRQNVAPGNPGTPQGGGNQTDGGRSLQQVECSPQTKTDMVLSGLRGAGETCGKLFTLAQSMASVIESVGRVFGNYQGPQYYVPGSNSYNPQQQSFQSGNIAWVPVNGSSCILQAIPTQQKQW